jgi:hypothetical protein
MAASNITKIECNLAIFFCGTDGSLDNNNTWIQYFHNKLCTAFDLTGHSPDDWSREHAISESTMITRSKNSILHWDAKLGFNGCGVDYGMPGVVFGSGLSDQCDTAITHITKIVKDLEGFVQERDGVKGVLKLNCVGLSRGAVAIALLAKMIAGDQFLTKYRSATPFSKDTHDSEFQKRPGRVEIEFNGFLFDPVPGNLIITGSCDSSTGISLTKQTKNLKKHCGTGLIRRMTAIYPYESLPDIACHAPLLIQYPDDCEVHEDVMLGCHQGAVFAHSYDLACICSFFQILEFLKQVGVEMDRDRCEQVAVDIFKCKDLNHSRMMMIRRMNEERDRIVTKQSVRHCHKPSTFTSATITRREVLFKADERYPRYLNKHHAALIGHMNMSIYVPEYILEIYTYNDLVPLAATFLGICGFVAGAIYYFV